MNIYLGFVNIFKSRILYLDYVFDTSSQTDLFSSSTVNMFIPTFLGPPIFKTDVDSTNISHKVILLVLEIGFLFFSGDLKTF